MKKLYDLHKDGRLLKWYGHIGSFTNDRLVKKIYINMIKGTKAPREPFVRLGD